MNFSISADIDVVASVEFKTFKAKADKDLSLLLWTTLTEKNSHYFAVERSRDGKKFAQIGRVEAQSTSNHEQKYVFEDHEPLKGYNYYRLKQVDKDGKSNYSHIEVLSFEGQIKDLTTYPNPVKDKLMLQTASREKISVVIYDQIGRVWLTNTFENGFKELDIAHLPQGLYIVSCTSDTHPIQRKFIKE